MLALSAHKVLLAISLKEEELHYQLNQSLISRTFFINLYVASFTEKKRTTLMYLINKG